MYLVVSCDKINPCSDHCAETSLQLDHLISFGLVLFCWSVQWLYCPLTSWPYFQVYVNGVNYNWKRVLLNVRESLFFFCYYVKANPPIKYKYFFSKSAFCTFAAFACRNLLADSLIVSKSDVFGFYREKIKQIINFP